jgi:hypothetical protein
MSFAFRVKSVENIVGVKDRTAVGVDGGEFSGHLFGRFTLRSVLTPYGFYLGDVAHPCDAVRRGRALGPSDQYAFL